MEADGSAPAGPSGSGGVRGAGEAGRGVEGGSAPIASVSTPAKDDVKAFNLEKFSGEDWASWSFRMELLFNHYGLLEVMDGELKRPASEGATKEWDRRSKDGFFLLSQCLSSNQLHHVKHLIKDIQCGSKAWKILKDVHAPSSEAMVVVLERQLHAVKINEGDAVQGAFDQLRDLYVKLSAAGVDYPENIKCYKALSLLLESWGPLVVNLNGMKDSWSLEWIRAQVLQEEFRRKELTTAAGEGGGSAYGMKGFKGRGSKKGKAKEGSGGEQYSGGKRSNKEGRAYDEGRSRKEPERKERRCRELRKKPLVDMLRVFGCMGLVHVPKEKRDKLQAAAVWAVHLGLARGSKGWLMWDPKSNTIFTTRDAKFMEGLMFKEWSERGRSKVTIPLGIEVGTNDPLLIPIELSSSSELTEVSHELGGAEGEAPIAERGDTEEEVQQPTPSPKLPPRRTTQGKRDAVRG
ncbi:unnamed protein product [Closterium sp. NIES-54]